MVAMAVPPGRRDQRREMIDQLQRRERQRRGAIALGPGQAIDDACGVEQFQTLERKWRAGTVTHQALQADASVRGDAHRRIQREAAVLPGQQFMPKSSRPGIVVFIIARRPAAGIRPDGAWGWLMC